MSSAGFWQDSEGSTKVVRELKELRSIVEPWDLAAKKYKELKDLLFVTTLKDGDLLHNLEQETNRLAAELEGLEFKTLLSGEFDSGNAILSINAGAGGTESCD